MFRSRPRLTVSLALALALAGASAARAQSVPAVAPATPTACDSGQQSAVAQDLAELGAHLAFLTEQLALARDERTEVASEALALARDRQRALANGAPADPRQALESDRLAAELAALDALVLELQAAIEDVVAETARVVADMERLARAMLEECAPAPPSARTVLRPLPSTRTKAVPRALGARLGKGGTVIPSAAGGTLGNDLRPRD